jgi:hypothetical protein
MQINFTMIIILLYSNFELYDKISILQNDFAIFMIPNKIFLYLIPNKIFIYLTIKTIFFTYS